MSEEKELFIFNVLKSQTNGSESVKVTLITDLHDGTSQLAVEKSIVDYYPVTEKEHVDKIFERLTATPRRVLTLENILDLLQWKDKQDE